MQRFHSMPFGAEVADDGVRFALWAPTAREVALVLGDKPHAMPAAESGWRRLTVPTARAGDRYRYRIDGGLMVPDPASRFQPDDITGPSRVVDARAFDWSDGDWTGRPWEEAVIYEVHVGTATPEGTYTGLAQRLEELRDLGMTAVELMPLADFPGRRNWGYDGVLPFAPDSSYGAPDDLKRLVDRAHGLGLMMFLDVVYNHFGPAGNYLHAYARSFFTERHQTPWGAGLNFDGRDARPVRDFFVHNALYWLEEYHF
ncbi:MAG: alpha-amylase family glycosyl hydrolase, partial [Microvirga sp.]